MGFRMDDVIKKSKACRREGTDACTLPWEIPWESSPFDGVSFARQ